MGRGSPSCTSSCSQETSVLQELAQDACEGRSGGTRATAHRESMRLAGHRWPGPRYTLLEEPQRAWPARGAAASLCHCVTVSLSGTYCCPVLPDALAWSGLWRFLEGS